MRRPVEYFHIFFLTKPLRDLIIETVIANNLFALVMDMGGHGGQPIKEQIIKELMLEYLRPAIGAPPPT
jgi:hypothetical protein